MIEEILRFAQDDARTVRLTSCASKTSDVCFGKRIGGLMTVKDVIVYAFKLLGREDAAENILNGEELDKDSGEKQETLLYCYNAVEDELARYYFPLTDTQQFASNSGVYGFDDFNFRPVKILSVKADGKPVKFKIHPKYFRCAEKSVEVEYQYAPDKKQLSDTSAYDGYAVGESLIAAGVLAEYCLISGAVQASKSWESKYREQIDKAQKKHRASITIPPRRWV